MPIGIIDLLSDAPLSGWRSRLYGFYFRKQFIAITPQAVAVWCRSLRHNVHYANYCSQEDPLSLIPTGRVEPGKDSVYGRKMVVELPDNKGRVMGAFYFTKGRMITLEATVPGGGDYASPDLGRFIDSIVFVLSRTNEGAVELKAPKLE